MNRIKYDLSLSEVPRPYQYFDLIGGTSTGGYVVDLPQSIIVQQTDILY